jgi:hypothetical protein
VSCLRLLGCRYPGSEESESGELMDGDDEFSGRRNCVSPGCG